MERRTERVPLTCEWCRQVVVDLYPPKTIICIQSLLFPCLLSSLLINQFACA